MKRKNKIKKNWMKYVPHLLTIVIVFLGYMYIDSTNTISLLTGKVTDLESDVNELVSTVQQKEAKISTQEQTISSQETEIEQNEVEIQSLNLQVTNLNNQVSSLSTELGQTQGELDETTRLLNVAQQYETRAIQGININEAYHLLGDYDKTVDIVAGITGVSTPADDSELWLRGKAIYDWIGMNYQYCSDKGFCISENQCTQIQFFSPDELLHYGSQDVLCGDCDDKAQLFAGMMYASGVPHEKVVVECGNVPGGGHCWNKILIQGEWYRIDPTCSDISEYVLDRFGLGSLSPASYPSNEIRVVDCFSEYGPVWIVYNADGVQ